MHKGLLMLLLLGGCAPVPGPEGAGPAVVEARLGESVRLGGLRVRPIAVLEDSRCPSDVTCIWAGRLRLRAAVSGGIGEIELTLGEPHLLSPEASLTLVTATPAPRHEPPSGPANRFGFRHN